MGSSLAGAAILGANDTDALLDLGFAYSTGASGYPMDLITAHKWFNLAALAGSSEAQYCRSDIADQIQDWFERDAADGFNLIPPLLPSSLTEFVDQVVPELQHRGLFRTEYEGTTLRQNLHLPRPETPGPTHSPVPAAPVLDPVS